MMVSNDKLKSIAIKPEDLEEQMFFSEGVHEITIKSAEFEENSAGSVYLKVHVSGNNGAETDTKLYFTEKSTKFSISTLRKILVHNAPSEDKKQEWRDYFSKNITNLLSVKALLPSLVGKQAWLKIEKDGGVYLDKNGNEKPSYSRNLFGFEPAMKSEAPKPTWPREAASMGPQVITGELVSPSSLDKEERDSVPNSVEQVDLSDIPF